MKHLLLSCIESRIENNRSLYGRFQVGFFDKGQGLTIANAIRRTLLSELSSLAIVCVEIPGVSHEYSSIKGVRESVLDILLNLKQINFISTSDYTHPEIGFLKIQGPAIIKSSDLKLPLYYQCVDPNQYIATLSDNTSLEMKFMICKGKGFAIQTSFDLISKNFQSYFSTKQESNIKIALLTKQKPTGKNTNQKSFDKVTFHTNENTSEIMATSQVVDKLSMNTVPNISNNSFKTQVTLPALKIPINQVSLLPKSTYTKYEIPEISMNKSISTFFLASNFFKKIEKSLLYSSVNISEFQSFRNLLYKENLKKKSMTNVLLIDAVFMPVVKVNFSIQNINKFYKIKNTTLINKFQKNFSQEKILLEIWTDGSIDPRNALYLTCQQIIDVFVALQKTCLLNV